MKRGWSAKIYRLFVFFLITGACCFFFSCSVFQKPGSKKNSDQIVLQDLCLDKFTIEKILVLQRYLKGSPRWDYRSERGMIYAFQLPQNKAEIFPNSKGFYESNISREYQPKTRIVLSFGQHLGYGGQEDVTFTDFKDKILKVNLFSDLKAGGKISSYLIIKGPGLQIEIFEQAENHRLLFTRQSILEINKELKMVLQNQNSIQEHGRVLDSAYLEKFSDSSYFKVNNGPQQGIFFVQAAYNADCEGKMFVKVFELAGNSQLSKKIIPSMSQRELGWDKNGKVFFNYAAEIIIYDSFNKQAFDARFELWFKDKTNTEILVASCKREIKAWEKQ